MNTKRIFRKQLLKPFLLLLLLLFSSINARAGDEPAAPLPESGLPALPNYTSNGSGHPLSRRLLPSRYDSREKGYVTPVKDQHPWGACWAFGALSAGEIGMIKKGIADTDIDLSEMHLAYFFYQCPDDPMGLTAGDGVKNHTGDYFLDTGGNNLFTMFFLSKWTGPASEALVPYTNSSSIRSAYAYQDAAHLQNVRFVNSADTANVKELILKYGAVSTAIFYHSSFQNTNGAYLFPYADNATNHIVSLVGWDDNYSRDNFSAVYKGRTIRPSSNGAWIAKNSYGTSFGDQGYIYISYEDVSFGQTSGDYLSYAFDMENADNYDHNYQYDGSFGSGMTFSMNGTSLANVYRVQGGTGNEQLDAVSFSLFSQNVGYSIQVYKNPSPGNPSSGSPVFTRPQTGQTTYSGYYTIPLDQKIVFAQGDTFSVVITFESVNGSSVQYFLDQTVSVSGLQFISNSAKNQSFYRSDASDGWIDLHTLGSGKTARIKAFTTDTTLPVTNVDVVTNTLKRPSITYLKRVSSNKIMLKWKSVKNAAKYEVYRSRSKNGIYRRITITKKTSYTDTKRIPGATYFYKIRARRTLNGAPAYSKYSSKKSVKLKLSAPILSRVKNVPGKKISVKWKKVTGAKGYEVFRSSSKKKGFKMLKSCKKTGYTDRLTKKKTYYYKVRAYTIIGKKKVCSSFSAVKKN